MLGAVASRYAHAFGILTGGSIYSANVLKRIGAGGTYVTGLILSLVLVIRAISLL